MPQSQRVFGIWCGSNWFWFGSVCMLRALILPFERAMCVWMAKWCSWRCFGFWRSVKFSYSPSAISDLDIFANDAGNYDIRRCKFYSMMDKSVSECGPTHSTNSSGCSARWRRRNRRYDILLLATIYYVGAFKQ